MPINGAIWKGAIRFRATAQATGSGSNSLGGSLAYSASLSAYTLYAPDAIDVAQGFTFRVSCHDDGDGKGIQGDAYYNGPGAPFGGLRVGGGEGGTLEVLLTDVVVWCRIDGGLPQIDYTLQVLYNGVRVLGDGVADGAYSFSQVGQGVGPNYVPLLGSVGGDASVDGGFVNWGLPGGDYDLALDYTVTGTVTLAYELQEAGSSEWLALPVSFPAGTINVEGTDTARVALTGLQSRHETGSRHTDQDGIMHVASDSVYTATGAGVLFVPGARRELRTMAPDHRCTLYRSGFPSTWSYGGPFHQKITTYDDWQQNVHTSTNDKDDGRVVAVLHPSLSAFKGLVEDAASALVLEPLRHDAPSAVNVSRYVGGLHYRATQTYSSAILVTNESTTDTTSMQFPYAGMYNGGVEDTDTNPYVSDWQYHYDPVQRYFGSWGSPFWKIGQWFPPSEIFDDGSQAPQSQWPLDGGPISPQYWKLGRSQWSGEPSAPEAERTRKRTDLIGSAVESSGLTLLYDNYWGQGFLRPLGWSRSPVMDCGPAGRADLGERCPDALDLREDSAPSWSSPDADLAFSASGVAVTPKDASQTTATVRLALNGWAAPPFLYPQTCGAVTVGFGSASRLDLTFLSALGGTATVEGVASGSGVPFPKGSDAGYAGTWGFENGVPDPTDPPNRFTEDLGADVAPGGRSAGAMGDPSTAQSPGGLAGHGAATLVLTLTLAKGTDGKAVPATLRYPTFRRAAGTPSVVYLTGAQAALLWPDGPAMLYGNLLFWDGASFNVPPVPTGMGYSPTIVDAIAVRRAYLQGVDPLAGGTTGTGTGTPVPPLTTELAARYTAFEGRSIAQVDRDSWTFLLPSAAGGVRWLLGNTYQEVPPIAMLQARARQGGAYAPAGAPWGGVYDLCKGPRDVVSPGGPLVLAKPDGTRVSQFQGGPSGWSIQRYDEPVGNDEGTDWTLSLTSTKVAKVRPFHGWLWEGTVATPDGSVHLSVDRVKGFFLSLVSDGSTVKASTFRISGQSFSGDVSEGTAGYPWTSADGFYGAAYSRDGSIYAKYSYDTGKTWGAEEMIAAGTLCAPAQDPIHGWDACAVWNAGDWHLWLKKRFADPSAETWADRGLIVSAPEKAAGLEFSVTDDAALVFAYSDGSNVQRLASYDYGLHWNNL